jgi:hypothetical protein
MTKDEALKLKPGDKIKKTQTGEIYIFQEFVTFDFGPPIGWGPTLLAKLLDPDGRIGFLQPRDMGPFELVKDG